MAKTKVKPTVLPPVQDSSDAANSLYGQLSMGVTAKPEDEPIQHIYAILNELANRLADQGF